MGPGLRSLPSWSLLQVETFPGFFPLGTWQQSPFISDLQGRWEAGPALLSLHPGLQPATRGPNGCRHLQFLSRKIIEGRKERERREERGGGARSEKQARKDRGREEE